jgi:hypothetical protein
MAKFDCVFSRHAKARMKERSISVKEVLSAIDHPDDVLIGKKGELSALKVVGGGKRIRVVYVIGKDQRIVISAMLTE